MLEALAYSFARGCVRAYLDVLKEQSKVYKEGDITDEEADLVSTAASILGMPSTGPNDYEPSSPPSDQQATVRIFKTD